MNDAGRIGFVIKGVYNNTETYDFLDVVYYNNSSYVAKKLTVGNPPADNSEYWQALAKVPVSAVLGVKGNAESTYRTGNINLTAANVGALPATREGSFFQKLNLDVEGYSYPSNCILTQGLDLNQISESGLYFCSSPINAPSSSSNGNGFMIAITYAGKTRGMQIYMPVGENKIYKRQNTNDVWGTWMEIMADTYAKRSIYGDTEMSLGRKSGTTVGSYSVVLGNNNTAGADWASAFGGRDNVSSGSYSSILGGCANKASSYCSATLGGESNTSSGSYSSVLGGTSNTASSDHSAILGGTRNTVSGDHSSVLGGGYNMASGNISVVLGGGTNTASGNYSAILGGTCNTASSTYSATTGGCNLSAENGSSIAHGHYNANMTTGGSSSNTTGTALAIGNGTSISTLSNAFSVMFNGVVKAKSTITGSTTADYAEFFEWLDGNPHSEDRVGRFVTLAGNKIVIANSNTDYILGIVSGEPFVLGNGDCDTWNGMFLKDDFNRTIYEPAPKMELDEETGKWVSVVDEKGNLVYEGTKPKLNPKYDPNQPYISRFDRKEWAPVGMLGVLSVIDDGSCQVNGFCCCNTDGIATACEKETEGACRIIERISDNVVRVVLK